MTRSATFDVLEQISLERAAQDAKWGEQNHPSFSPSRDVPYRERLRDTIRAMVGQRAAAGTLTWSDILDEEIAETCAEVEPAKIRAELVQSAAVIVAWIECIDRAEAAS